MVQGIFDWILTLFMFNFILLVIFFLKYAFWSQVVSCCIIPYLIFRCLCVIHPCRWAYLSLFPLNKILFRFRPVNILSSSLRFMLVIVVVAATIVSICMQIIIDIDLKPFNRDLYLFCSILYILFYFVFSIFMCGDNDDDDTTF